MVPGDAAPARASPLTLSVIESTVRLLSAANITSPCDVVASVSRFLCEWCDPCHCIHGPPVRRRHGSPACGAGAASPSQGWCGAAAAIPSGQCRR